ncbi:MAG: cytochrome c [Pseudomonadales bacterium]|nr:cytochrome c [Pseudomonadales bacterium]
MRFLIAAFLGLFATSTLASEADAEYRKFSMAAVGGHMQAIVKIIRQEVPHVSHLELHADAIADLANISSTLFPAGSEGGDALPASWEDFQSNIDAFSMAAADFSSAASSGDTAAIGGGLMKLGQSCKGCHDDYRAE